jgi:hypothetical protein
LELLGAAVGDDDFVSTHAHDRTVAASQLLDAIGGLDDAQVGVRLLRSSAGHCRLVHSMRCSPPGPQMDSFKMFDQRVRACFSSLTGLHPTDTQWQQAARSFAQAGLGLRSTHLDGPAAYLSSAGKSRQLCAQLDSKFSDADFASGHFGTTLQLYNSNLPPAQQVTLQQCLGQPQKQLTTALDNISWEAQLSSSTLTGRALLLSEAAPGARAFLAARPHGLLRMEPAIFVTELRHRLGLPDAAEDTWCPQCNGVLDHFSLHAGACSAGGGTHPPAPCGSRHYSPMGRAGGPTA